MSYRKERIEKLLSELEYEIIRGVMDREIDPFIQFRFFVNISNSEFCYELITRKDIFGFGSPSRLKIVSNKDLK